MTDEELHALLRRHRPVGPRAALRGRILTSIHARPRVWPWAAAAAALVACTAGFLDAAQQMRQSLRVAESAPARQTAVEDLTVALGGGDEARMEAERMIAERDRIRELEELRATHSAQGQSQ